MEFKELEWLPVPRFTPRAARSPGGPWQMLIKRYLRSMLSGSGVLCMGAGMCLVLLIFGITVCSTSPASVNRDVPLDNPGTEEPQVSVQQTVNSLFLSTATSDPSSFTQIEKRIENKLHKLALLVTLPDDCSPIAYLLLQMLKIPKNTFGDILMSYKG